MIILEIVMEKGREKVDAVVRLNRFWESVMPHEMPAGAEQLALARLKSGGNLSVKEEKVVELTLATLIRRLLLDSKVGLLKE